jgi:hypothetical protein
MTKIFPLLIAALVLTLAGPLAVDWVGAMTLDALTPVQEALQ